MCRISNLGLGQVRKGFGFLAPRGDFTIYVCLQAPGEGSRLPLSALGDPRQLLISVESL